MILLARAAAWRALMRFLAALLVTLIALVPVGSEPRNALEGVWSGDGMRLRIDPDRAQANKELTRPFTWENFWIRHARGTMVIFMIGETQFIGRLERDKLSVTRLDSSRWWLLQRTDLYAHAP